MTTEFACKVAQYSPIGGCASHVAHIKGNQNVIIELNKIESECACESQRLSGCMPVRNKKEQ